MTTDDRAFLAILEKFLRSRAHETTRLGMATALMAVGTALLVKHYGPDGASRFHLMASDELTNLHEGLA
jgi:hypothetical protein